LFCLFEVWLIFAEVKSYREEAEPEQSQSRAREEERRGEKRREENNTSSHRASPRLASIRNAISMDIYLY
jgi:hypothetical protein